MALKDEIIADVKQFCLDIYAIFRPSCYSKLEIENKIRDYFKNKGKPQSAHRLYATLFDTDVMNRQSKNYVRFNKFYNVLIDMRMRGLLTQEQPIQEGEPVIWHYHFWE